MKGDLLEIDVSDFSCPSFKPSVKSKLESSKKQKEYDLEGINKKLEHAATIRANLLQLKEEKLRILSQERESRIRRKESSEELEKEERAAKLTAEHEEAERRRAQRQKELIGRLQERNGKVLKVATEVGRRKREQVGWLKTRIMGKLQEYELHREKGKEERVKRLENYHSKLAKAVQDRKTKEEKKIEELATITERKQLQARENRNKHIQRVKTLAEEVADKVKKIQEFVYESECA